MKKKERKKQDLRESCPLKRYFSSKFKGNFSNLFSIFVRRMSWRVLFVFPVAFVDVKFCNRKRLALNEKISVLIVPNSFFLFSPLATEHRVSICIGLSKRTIYLVEMRIYTINYNATSDAVIVRDGRLLISKLDSKYQCEIARSDDVLACPIHFALASLCIMIPEVSS